MKRFIIQMGRFLFSYRAWIAVPFFIVLVSLSRENCYTPIPYICILWGIIIRLWGAGYLGKQARANVFMSQYKIINGPFRFFKHPLYIGNFLLVIGFVFIFNPPLWYAIMLILLFIIEYGIIIWSENSYIKSLPEKKGRFYLSNLKGELSTVGVIFFIFIILWVKSELR